MSAQPSIQQRWPYLVVAALFAIWGILGLVDQSRVPYSGYYTDGNNTVTRVDAGSPAEAANLKAGDYIMSTAGIPMQDTRALSRLPRAAIGETRTLVVEPRSEIALGAAEIPASRSLNITYAGLPGRNMAIGYAAFIVGLCFLVFGLWPSLRMDTRSATLLALMGLCLGLAFFAGPYIRSAGLRTLVSAVQLVIILFGFAFLLHFMLEFPKAKTVMGNRGIIWWIYGPAALFALFTLYLNIFQPQGTSTLNVVVTALFGIFVVLYFGLALWAMIHTYVRATAEERSRYGLNFMLIGVIIGLVPVTFSSLIGIFAPRFVPAGVDFYFLTLVLVPIALALAVAKLRPAPGAVPTM
jgi:hypothetical protein